MKNWAKGKRIKLLLKLNKSATENLNLLRIVMKAVNLKLLKER